MKKQFIGAALLLPVCSVAIAQYQPEIVQQFNPYANTVYANSAPPRGTAPHRGSGRREAVPTVVVSLLLGSDSGTNSRSAIITKTPTPFQLPIFVG